MFYTKLILYVKFQVEIIKMAKDIKTELKKENINKFKLYQK
jgi:hypothetical protein